MYLQNSQMQVVCQWVVSESPLVNFRKLIKVLHRLSVIVVSKQCRDIVELQRELLGQLVIFSEHMMQHLGPQARALLVRRAPQQHLLPSPSITQHQVLPHHHDLHCYAIHACICLEKY